MADDLRLTTKEDVYRQDYGSTRLTNWWVDDIRLVHALTEYKELIPHTFSNETDLIRLHFSLKGRYSFDHKQLNKSFEIQEGHHNIMYSNGFEMTVKSREQLLETFGIQFSKEAFIRLTQNTNDVLARFAEDIIEGRDTILSSDWEIMNPQISAVVQDILHCRFSGGMKNLFLLSKSIELLVLQAESYEQQKKRKVSTRINKADKDKLMDARDFVLQNLHQPPSLSKVAKTIGLNEYKLKKGFKELFQQTVYGFLTDQRLVLGRQILMDTNKTATEVAFELGYSSLSHFSNAFKKKYGTSPKASKKQ